ncbi:hypothetical protein MMPV_005168 [Pyropia vietnamensis]
MVGNGPPPVIRGAPPRPGLSAAAVLGERGVGEPNPVAAAAAAAAAASVAAAASPAELLRHERNVLASMPGVRMPGIPPPQSSGGAPAGGVGGRLAASRPREHIGAEGASGGGATIKYPQGGGQPQSSDVAGGSSGGREGGGDTSAGSQRRKTPKSGKAKSPRMVEEPGDVSDGSWESFTDEEAELPPENDQFMHIALPTTAAVAPLADKSRGARGDAAAGARGLVRAVSKLRLGGGGRGMPRTSSMLGGQRETSSADVDDSAAAEPISPRGARGGGEGAQRADGGGGAGAGGGSRARGMGARTTSFRAAASAAVAGLAPSGANKASGSESPRGSTKADGGGGRTGLGGMARGRSMRAIGRVLSFSKGDKVEKEEAKSRRSSKHVDDFLVPFTPNSAYRKVAPGGGGVGAHGDGREELEPMSRDSAVPSSNSLSIPVVSDGLGSNHSSQVLSSRTAGGNGSGNRGGNGVSNGRLSSTNRPTGPHNKENLEALDGCVDRDDGGAASRRESNRTGRPSKPGGSSRQGLPEFRRTLSENHTGKKEAAAAAAAAAAALATKKKSNRTRSAVSGLVRSVSRRRGVDSDATKSKRKSAREQAET